MTLLILPDDVEIAMIWAFIISGANCFSNVVEVNISAILKVVDRNLWMELNVVLLGPISVFSQNGINAFEVSWLFKRVLEALFNPLPLSIR